MTTPREIIDDAFTRLNQHMAKWAEEGRTHGMVHCSEVANWAELGRNCGFQGEAVIGPASHAEPVPAAARGMHSHDINWPMHSHNIGEEAADVGAVGNAAPAGRSESATPYPPSNAQRELLPVRVAELRPPLRHHGKPFHFIQTAGCVPQVARWDGWRWQVWSPALWTWVETAPSELGHWGYLGPAEWHPTPEPGVSLAQLMAAADLMDSLTKRYADLAVERNELAIENADLAKKLDAAEDLAEKWRAEVVKLDPGRFVPAKLAFPANALKYSA